ncbi:hypothetical protein [Kaistella yonginensis]|uniref:hypothetical protein n=1 Tax=Kaistella yonginensis TaxID=658267 RepID=UPI0025B51681|nr:hypothetical protein [Kaistella yonginensis]MDN3605976.1 hypothetical protein [Kaistella yonginensis]
MKRTDIIHIIIEEQNVVIDSLKQSVDRYKIASDLDEESTHDPEDFSQQTQAKDMQLRYEKMLKEAERNLSFLEGELKLTHDKIEKGTLVETDKNFLFVGISVPVFKFENKEVIAFSDQAPVFQNIKGKNKGQTVEVGPNVLQIIDIN